MPTLEGESIASGNITLAPATITFLAFAEGQTPPADSHGEEPSAAEIMDPHNRNVDFIPYPTDRVVGTIDDAKKT